MYVGITQGNLNQWNKRLLGGDGTAPASDRRIYYRLRYS